MDRKIRVGAVSYLNTRPLLYGIQHSALIRDIDLVIAYPSRIASLLLEDAIDIGLVPVAVIPEMQEYYINTHFCIGSDGPVALVCLFSEIPIQNATRILLDYQSRTSVELVKVLLKEYWKTDPELLDTKQDFRHQIKGATAGLMIGDRALEQRKISHFVYDLGEAWKNLTGLPFVYAAWISNKKLDDSFLYAFNQANANGLNDLEKLLVDLNSDLFDLRQYYTKFISYPLNDAKMLGLNFFLSKLQK